MKKVLVLISFIPFLYGCTFSPTAQQQQKVMGNEEYKSKSGKTWSVNKLREDYKEKTGYNLVPPNTYSCGWDSTCYQNAWASNYDKGIADFNSKQDAEHELAESKCTADPACKRSRDLDKASNGLTWGYSMLIGTNPHNQAEYDYLVRDVCEKVTIAQQKGLGRDDLVNRMRDAPGIAPRERGVLKDVVKSCWDISNLSGDWREYLRQ